METSNAKKRYWFFSPGEKAACWEEFYEAGIMAIDYGIGDLSKYDSKEAIKQQMNELHYGDETKHTMAVHAAWQFLKEIKIGDVVFAKEGRNKLVGRGVVTSDYFFDESRQTYKNVRSVKWTNKGEWYIKDVESAHGHRMPSKTLTDITQFNEYPLEIDARITGNAICVGEENAEITPNNYWWLNAKPGYWNIKEMKVGEEISYSLRNENGNKRQVYSYFLAAKVGDLVIGYSTSPDCMATSVLKVIKTPNDNDENIHFEKVKELEKPIPLRMLKPCPELKNLEFFSKAQGSLFKMTKDEFNFIVNFEHENDVFESYSRADFLSEVYIDAEEYDKLVALLDYKYNIILQGAPGVGKTFAAKRLAYSIMGLKDDSRVKLVQFHQNYSYEDFIEGYRPNDSGGFVLRTGVFKDFCQQANDDPQRTYFFIIDEINRGNLSKIMGELFMLVEKEYRGTSIRLTYADAKSQEFCVPENLRIIGMMNTADRSLAMLDYALRRRFSFYTMHPAFNSQGFSSLLSSINSPIFDKLIVQVKALNEEIADDTSLGAGFCIGHSYFCGLTPDNFSAEKLKMIVDYELVPMLEEYWFDEPQKVSEWKKRLTDALNE